jgi:hypothetical protein
VLLRSRYVKRVHTLPAFSPTNDAWKRAFVELCDASATTSSSRRTIRRSFRCQEHRRDVEPHARIYLLNDRAFEVGYDKLRSYEVCNQVGVRVPKIKILPIPADPADVLRDFQLPSS